MLYTRINEILGIKYPLFQGGMAHISDGKLAAAVSEAGGLGIITSVSRDPDFLLREIEYVRSVTDKPFGVNVMLQSPDIDKTAALLAREKVPVVTTGAGDPSRFMEDWQATGIKVIPVIASAAMAKRAERNGACAVVAEGGESGGHVGETTTMSLVPQVCDAVSIPVIAAGGIADGRGVAASFMLGAEGVQLGTRFLAANECCIHPVYKQKVLKASDISTIVTGKRLGHPVRSLKTPFSREYAKAEYSAISDDDLEKLAVGALRLAVCDGDEQRGCFLAGQIAGMVNEELPAGEIVRGIMKQAEDILCHGGSKWVR